MEGNKQISLDSNVSGQDNMAHLKSVFGSDHQFIFAYKKTEKLVAAIHLVSNLIKDEDPLKWKLRANSLSLLSDILLLSSAISFGKGFQGSNILKIKSLVIETLSLLEVGKMSKVMSEMNVTILHREYLILLNILTEEESRLSTPGFSALSEDFFTVPAIKENFYGVENQTATPMSHKGQSKGHSMSFIKKETNLVSDVVSHSSQKRQNDLKDSSYTRSSSGIDRSGTSERRSIILSALKTKKEVGINDIGLLIKGCSSKTIQRELLSMVSEGVLKKEGERRWSKYRLA